MPLEEDLRGVLRIVLRRASVLARPESELGELERRVFPHQAVALALILAHVLVRIQPFVGELDVVPSGHFDVSLDERRDLQDPAGRRSFVGNKDAGSQPADDAGSKTAERALHAAPRAATGGIVAGARADAPARLDVVRGSADHLAAVGFGAPARAVGDRDLRRPGPDLQPRLDAVVEGVVARA